MKKFWMLLLLMLGSVVMVRAEDAFDDDNSGMTVVVRNMSSKTIVVKPEKKGSSCGGQNFTSGDDFRMGPGETRVLRTGRSVVAGKKKDCELNEFKIFDTKEVEFLGSKMLVASDLIAQLDLARLNGEKFNGNGHSIEIVDNPLVPYSTFNFLGKQIQIPVSALFVHHVVWYDPLVFIEKDDQFALTPSKEQVQKWLSRTKKEAKGQGLSVWFNNLSDENVQVIPEESGSSCPQQSFNSGEKVSVSPYTAQQFYAGIVAGGPEKGTYCDLKRFKVLDAGGKEIVTFRITLKSLRKDLIKAQAGRGLAITGAVLAGAASIGVGLGTAGVGGWMLIAAGGASAIGGSIQIDQAARDSMNSIVERQKEYPFEYRIELAKTPKGDWVYAIVRGR